MVEAAIAGRIYAQLKSRAKQVGTQDILVAAICAANDLLIYTKNISHFSAIQDIRLLCPEEILSPGNK